MRAPTDQELVVLVDDDGRPVGTAPKATVHTARTPLHRAFSCYVFDAAGRLLVTRRAESKATFPALWTNTVCGHPGPGEDDTAAVARRAAGELGISVHDVTCALPRFRYRAEHGGIVENEICPVYLARTDDQPQPDPAEVTAHDWATWPQLLDRLAADETAWSPWCRLQVAELADAVAAYLAAS
ncbi:MAG TPA: isopentenyl-diphosphate Delta-isomerase [Mycobacteriales bacterium]|nr:isopentenyl-diphosphate Delta-isomerase [Mycobacteriales bacterium]